MPIDLLPDQEQQSQRTKSSMGHDARPIPQWRRWRWLLVVAACALVLIAVRHLYLQDVTPPRPAEARQNGAPVHVAAVASRSFPVILNGLGTVQATNTVTVRSRVDGQIERVAFEEGQMVKQGDLLVQIDPAPFQAALDQAKAKLGQDQASLINAKQQLQPISVVFTAPESQLPAIAAALKSASLPVTALSSDGKKELAEGSLQLIDNQV